MRNRIAAFGLLAMALLAIAQFAANMSAAGELILLNGHVKTPTGWAQAVVVREGIITAVGDTAALRAMVTPHAVVFDLAGATLLPSLFDSHVHPLFAGMEQFACRLAPAASVEAVAAAVKTCAARHKPGEWIQGGNWVAAAFKPGQQTKAVLDRAAPNNPVLLNDEAHHSIWVNSLALKLAGIARDTPNPTGGIIERDQSGEATGLLRESATRLVQLTIPPASMESRRRALVLATNQMLSFGITSFTVASVRMADIGPLSALSGEGLIRQHVRGCIVWGPGPEDGNTMGDTLITARASYVRPRFSLDCVKVFVDGVPTESHTAVMLQPYADSGAAGDEARPERGLSMISQAVLSAAVRRFDELGLSIKFHAVGDGAVREALDAVAAARQANGFGGPTHSIAHATFVDPADIPRARDLQVAWEFSPYIWYPTPIASDILAAVGPERMRRFIPVREAVETGALVVAGSDWSVVPSVNPWLAMETLVTRQKPGGSPDTLGDAERISLEQAFRIFTVNGARLVGQGDRLGAIVPGLHADLIVTDRNPFEIPIAQLHAIKVKMTFIDGEKVFDSAAPPALIAR